MEAVVLQFHTFLPSGPDTVERSTALRMKEGDVQLH